LYFYIYTWEGYMGQGGEEDHGEGTKVYGEVIKLRSLTDD
jgi:hypothetical protein